MTARERARQGACTSNLRQLALAINLYAADNSQLMPPYATDAVDVLAARRKVIHLPGQSQQLKTCLRPYIHSEAIWYCPDDSPPDVRWKGTVFHYDTSYRYDGRFFSEQPGMLSIAFAKNGPSTPDMWSNMLMGEDCSPNWDSLHGDYSHSGRSNVLFRDGHVASSPIHSSTYDYPDTW